MPKARRAETRARIQSAALELFAEQGLQQTSLREIAERLGMTKPALYYHFASREELVHSLTQPVVEEMSSHLTELESASAAPREVLGRYFDVTHRHRKFFQVAVRDVSVLRQLSLSDHLFDWRRRLVTLLVGPSPSLEQKVRGVVALGGLSACVLDFDDVDVDHLRTAATAAAYDALRPADG
jgi:AcrR family transcriptional regulator